MYRNTSLWKRTLGIDDPAVKRLRKNFEQSRKNVTFLLDKIRGDFPFLTRHDITHVDSLWRVADTIIGKDYRINPLEGYILGIAFLIHDLALSYDTVGGKGRLRKTNEWLDAYAGGCPPGMTDEDFKKECDFTAIRLRHAKEAETILDTVFPTRDGRETHILGEDDFGQFIRKHYGHSIGLIAASHHWSIDDVESRLDPEKDPVEEISLEWGVDEWKLACILRCADAGHIDNGRAPDSLYKHLVLNGVSRLHWEAQNHLSVVTEDTKDKTLLRIKSIEQFPKSEFAAWMVAYAAVRQFDEEIRKSNNLLRPRQLSFPHEGVCGASSKEALKKYVTTTDEWEPFDCSVHTSNIKTLIENLGGPALYDEDPLLIVMRELIQNARDAIHARSRIRSSFSLDDGKITIKYFERDGKRFIDVSDNGIGMTLDCIKNQLLDFGGSYWKSSLCRYESPGLMSSGFSPIGKFGIGFFSVFMIAKSVEILTKRFDRFDKPLRIEFPNGLTLSPILSKCELDETLSTLIRLELNDDIKLVVQKDRMTKIKLSEALPILVVGLDADVYYGENSIPKCIHTSILSKRFSIKRWFISLIPPSDYRFFKKSQEFQQVIEELTFLKEEDGSIRGIIAPFPDTFESDQDDFFQHPLLVNMPTLVTIGGLATDLCYSYWLYGILEHDYYGFLDCRSFGISRERATMDHSLLKILQIWGKEKYWKHYYGIAENDPTSFHYESLLCCLELHDSLLAENEIRLYSGEHNMSGITPQSLRCILFITKHLMNGVDLWQALHVNNGPCGLLYKHKLQDVDDGLLLMALSTEAADTDSESLQSIHVKIKNFDEKEITILKDTILSIGRPIHSFDDILKLYLSFSNNESLHFNDAALQVWTNILLDKFFDKMIDWRAVRDKDRFKSAKSDNANEFIDLVKQYCVSKNMYIDALKAYL